MASKPRTARPSLMVGAATRDITSGEVGSEMLGWANSKNLIDGIAMPLACRAVVLEDPRDGRTLAMVSCEILFITQSIRDAVLERMSEVIPEACFRDSNLFLTATHTHSGPGGFSYDLMYTLPTPGFRAAVWETLVGGICAAVVEAWRRRRPSTLHIVRDAVPAGEPVAFNRSIEAFNKNPDAPIKAAEETRNLAVNRDMTLLWFRGTDGVPIAAWNFFAVHCTSVHADNRQIHPDNKGYAAQELENWARTHYDAPEFVAVFAQGAAGDVSPNFRWDPDRKIRVGAHDDDFKSARFNGEIQAEHARRLCVRADATAPTEPVVDGTLSWLDFSAGAVDQDFADGLSGRTTSWARMGMPFMEGTAEGPGPWRPLRRATEWMIAGVHARKQLAARVGLSADGALDSHGPMYPFLEAGKGGAGRAFGLFNMGRPFLPEWFDPGVAQVRQISSRQAMGDRPWIPNVMPVQIVRIGSLAIAALPGEPTTMAGRRVDQDLLATLAPSGVTLTLTAGYANGYAAYITTRDEYLVQDYEGGATLFGQWTLGAYRTRIRHLGRAMLIPAHERRYNAGPRPPLPAPDEIEARRPENLRLPKNWIR